MNIFQPITDVQARIDQGDVFLDIYFPAIDARVNAVVVTPTCDLKHDKAHFVKFISTVSLGFVIKVIVDSVGIGESVLESGTPITKKQCDNVVKALRRNINGDFLPRYYLLPEYLSVFPASYLDFQRTFVMPTQQVYHEYLGNRVARVISPWREQIVAQYAGYSLRVGTPDYSNEDLQDLLTAAGLQLSIEVEGVT